jgi:mannose/fructose-specific phosphotransferase system component IIA
VRAFRVVIASHGSLAAGLAASAQMIVGQLSDVVVVALEPGMTPEQFDARLADAIGPGCALVLCDLRGGTPHNRAQLAVRRTRGSVCLAGANLAMVLEAVTAQGELRPATVARIAAAGRAGITESGPRRTC